MGRRIAVVKRKRRVRMSYLRVAVKEHESEPALHVPPSAPF
jgi:hypothetical protein